MQQIVVVKGWEGFADRLQVLSHCMHYCVTNDAAICVDWRDYMWGQEYNNFSDYFEIVGIPVVTIEEVCDRIRSGATIESPWTLEEVESVPTELIHYKEYKTTISSDYYKLDEDIIVHYGKGIRTWHLYTFINHIRLKPSVAEIIKTSLEPLRMPYTIVHLRGTDRLSDDVIEDAVSKFDVLPLHAKARVYVISDMKNLCDTWLESYPNTKILEPNSCIFKLPPGKQGTHMLPQEVLEFYGITKFELNVNTIRDFLLFAFSSWHVGHSTSIFTRLAIHIRSGGVKGVGKWLGGFVPQREALSQYRVKEEPED